MIRSEVIRKIAISYPALTAREAERAVIAIFEEIVTALGKGGRVEIRGFGSFSTRRRDARQGRNPKTGEPVAVEAKSVVYFRAGRILISRLNGKTE